MSRQDNIGRSRKVRAMEAKSKAQSMKRATDDQLRAGILGAHGLHDPSTLFR